MNNEIEIIERFYQAFSKRDAEAIASLYADEVVFKDPAFGTLKGERAKNMWRMLFSSQKTNNDYKSEASNIRTEGDIIKGSLQAWYTFNPTKRKVHNIIEGSFKIENGKIIEHKDSFDLWRWSRQAMGLSGVFLGWTPFFRKELQKKTNKMLDKFESKL